MYALIMLLVDVDGNIIINHMNVANISTMLLCLLSSAFLNSKVLIIYVRAALYVTFLMLHNHMI